MHTEPTPIRIHKHETGPNGFPTLTIDNDPSEPNCNVALRYDTIGQNDFTCDTIYYQNQEWQIIAEHTRYADPKTGPQPTTTIEIIPLHPQPTKRPHKRYTATRTLTGHILNKPLTKDPNGGPTKKDPPQ